MAHLSMNLSGRPSLRRCAPAPRRTRCTASQQTSVGTKSYLDELRQAAMKLHTREQLGKKKEGAEQDQPKRPPFEPKVLGYLRFLQESKAVFDCLERTVAESDHPDFALFKHTGLERGPALAKDLEWFATEKQLQPLPMKDNGPGLTYCRLLESLAAEDVPAFMCHYYNVYFAHTAGGRMIGQAVSNAILDGADLEFYKYDGDVKEIGAKVKDSLNAVAEGWDADARQRSVDQTADSFKYAGSLLKCITQACDCDCPRQ